MTHYNSYRPQCTAKQQCYRERESERERGREGRGGEGREGEREGESVYEHWDQLVSSVTMTLTITSQVSLLPITLLSNQSPTVKILFSSSPTL